MNWLSLAFFVGLAYLLIRKEENTDATLTKINSVDTEDE